MSKRNRTSAERSAARRRRLEREADERWLGHFGPERTDRQAAWSSVTPAPKQR